ncbi:MAG: 30S ribosomal protein S5 [Pelagibacteraceae bacterium]|nr:30S ribosomal protein S5 [Pelagibacteraceae bacterium]|tara:strand:- start:6104 stop:6658 length:555 start_codon:yes stop_codon:yes gene_type:complete
MEIDIKKYHKNNSENLIEKVVYVNRVSKVVKGGRRFGTAALVVVGNGKGKAGFGNGKAKEFPESIKKATDKAKKSMKYFPLKKNRTFFYDVEGRHGSGKVLLRSAPPGTGIIAGGPIRSVFEALGVQDVVAKSIGTTNPHNMVRATFNALGQLDDIKKIAQRRGKQVTDLYYKKKSNGKENDKK